MEYCRTPEENYRCRRSLIAEDTLSRSLSPSRSSKHAYIEDKLSRSLEIPISPRYHNLNKTFTVPNKQPQLLKCKVYSPDGVDLNTTFTVLESTCGNTSLFKPESPKQLSSYQQQETTQPLSYTPEKSQRSSRISAQTKFSQSPTVWAIPKVAAPRVKSKPKQLYFQTKPGTTRFKIKCSGRKPIPINERPDWVGLGESRTQYEIKSSRKVDSPYFLAPSNSLGNPISGVNVQGPNVARVHCETRPSKLGQESNRYALQSYLDDRRNIPENENPEWVDVDNYCEDESVTQNPGRQYVTQPFYDNDDVLQPQLSDTTRPPFPEWYTPGVRWNPERKCYEPIYEVETVRGPHISSRFKDLHVPGRVNEPGTTSEADKQLEEQLFHAFRYVYSSQPDQSSTDKEVSKNSRKRWQLKDNTRDCPAPAMDHTPLELQFLDRSQPPYPDWESANVKWIPDSGGYEPIYELNTKKGPHTSCLFKHFRVPVQEEVEKTDKPDVVNEPQMQLEKNVYHGVRNIYSPHTLPEHTLAQHNVKRRVWNEPSQEPLYAEKTQSAPRRRKWKKSYRGRNDGMDKLEQPSWIHNAQFRREIPKEQLPKWNKIDASHCNIGETALKEQLFTEALMRGSFHGWAEDADSCSEPDESADGLPSESSHVCSFIDSHQGCEEIVPVPHWAQQVTVNSLNETIIFKDDKLKYNRMRSKPNKIQHKLSGASSFLNDSPSWIQVNGGKQEYINRLPQWIHALDSSEHSKMNYINNIRHPDYSSEFNRMRPAVEDHLRQKDGGSEVITYCNYGNHRPNNTFTNYKMDRPPINAINNNQSNQTYEFRQSNRRCRRKAPKLRKSCGIRRDQKSKRSSNKSRYHSEQISTSNYCDEPVKEENRLLPMVPQQIQPTQVRVQNDEKKSRRKDFILNLIRSPIETFDNIVKFMSSVEALDEEDISAVENFDECTSKPFTFKEEDNILTYLKEKHLKQAIAYTKMATDLIIKKHLCTVHKIKQNELKKKRGMKCDDPNKVEANIVERIEQADDMIEVIGYVGCTGNMKQAIPSTMESSE